MYEVMITGGIERHTKYFYGISGDRIAQITADGVTLVALTEQAQFYQLAGLNIQFDNLPVLAKTVCYKTMLKFAPLINFSKENKVITIFLLLSIFLAWFMLKKKFKDEADGKIQTSEHSPLFHSFVTLVIFLFLFQLIFYSCSSSDTSSDGFSYPIDTSSATGISIPLSTYNDTTMAFPYRLLFSSQSPGRTGCAHGLRGHDGRQCKPG